MHPLSLDRKMSQYEYLAGSYQTVQSVPVTNVEALG